MSCTNCYDGCAEITSDKCVRYTGVDVPILGVQNGDSISVVEQALMTFLISTLDGSGIILTIPDNVLCDLVSNNLPTCGNLTVTDLFITLIKCICCLQTQQTETNTIITGIEQTLSTLNRDYDILTLPNVQPYSGTHDILQAVITLLCGLNSSIPATYVPLSELNDLIAAYLASQSSSTLLCNKMTPYVVYPFYPPSSELSYFNNGAGTGKYLNIYICNGLNNTPDLRGVTLVGDTTAYAGASYNSKVNPGISGNPTYNAGAYSITGNNTITLDPTQIPQTTHTHTVNDPGHTHTVGYYNAAGGGSGAASGIGYSINQTYTTPSNTTGITLGSKSLYGNGTGDGGAASHSNIQPSVAVYYIMYIPA